MSRAKPKPVDVDAVAAAVSACRSVAELSGGAPGEIATYLPGRRVPGIRVTDDRFEVHVVARWVSSLPSVGAEVASAARPLAGGREVMVFIDDLADRPELKADYAR